MSEEEATYYEIIPLSDSLKNELLSYLAQVKENDNIGWYDSHRLISTVMEQIFKFLIGPECRQDEVDCKFISFMAWSMLKCVIHGVLKYPVSLEEEDKINIEAVIRHSKYQMKQLNEYINKYSELLGFKDE